MHQELKKKKKYLVSISDKVAVNNIILFILCILYCVGNAEEFKFILKNDQKCVKGVSYQNTSMCCRTVLSLRLSPPVTHDVIVLVWAAVSHLR